MMKENQEVFRYTYSAKQQEEIRKIQEKYLPQEDDKLEQLRKLDQCVIRSGTIPAIVLGLISTLILGVGMCCTMVWAEKLFLPGIFIGIIGILGVGAAYPLYCRIIRRKRKQLAPQILELTRELMEEEN